MKYVAIAAVTLLVSGCGLASGPDPTPKWMEVSYDRAACTYSSECGAGINHCTCTVDKETDGTCQIACAPTPGVPQ